MAAVQTMLPYELPPKAVRWTRAMCSRLEDAELLCDRYELVDGVIISMGQNMPHADIVMALIEWLVHTFGRKFVATQTSIDVRPEEIPSNEPMPDAIVLTRPSGQFDRYPKPEEIRLLVEVSDSTLRFDLTTKAGLYARAEIVEYWVIDLRGRVITVHRNPSMGVYQNIEVFQEYERMTSLAAPDNPISVAQLLPERGAPQTL